MVPSLSSTDADDSSCSRFTSRTTVTSPSLSPSRLMYGGAYEQNDVVGRYLAQRADQQAYFYYVQSLRQGYATEQAGYLFSDHQQEACYESHSYGNAGPRLPYPDPEHIRHLHTLHSLLPHIQPERKLNALSSPELDILDGSGQILYRAVPKKLLTLFLGRTTVSKFLRTTSRVDNNAWTGPPTQQLLVLPHGTASKSSLTILIAWMTRACRAATMHTMKQMRVPGNLFAACSLAQTLELFGLHRDAYRVDAVVSDQFRYRVVHAVELEALWNCLGEGSKYVYGCIRALHWRMRAGRVSEELLRLGERYPRLWERLSDESVNEDFKPEFGRRWFADLVPNDSIERAESLRAEARRYSRRALDPSAPLFEPSGS